LDPSKSKCPGEQEICCLHPDFEKPPVGPVPIPVPLPSPVPEDQSVAPVIIQPAAPKPYKPRCGQHHIGGIQNSKEDSGTQFGEWPNMCAVLNRYLSI